MDIVLCASTLRVKGLNDIRLKIQHVGDRYVDFNPIDWPGSPTVLRLIGVRVLDVGDTAAIVYGCLALEEIGQKGRAEDLRALLPAPPKPPKPPTTEEWEKASRQHSHRPQDKGLPCPLCPLIARAEAARKGGAL